MEKIEKLYDKFNGSYFFFIGVIISIVTIVISVMLYTLGGASYSIFNNFISDLGAVSAPNNAFIAFNTGLIVNSLVSPFGALFLVAYFKKKNIRQNWMIWLWFSIEIISIIANFLVALFPEDTMSGPHTAAAINLFFFGMLSNIFYGILIILTNKVAKYHSIPGFILAIISFIFMMSWISIITLFEWLVLFGGWIFGVYIGVFTLKTQ